MGIKMQNMSEGKYSDKRDKMIKVDCKNVKCSIGSNNIVLNVPKSIHSRLPKFFEADIILDKIIARTSNWNQRKKDVKKQYVAVKRERKGNRFEGVAQRDIPKLLRIEAALMEMGEEEYDL